MAIVAPWAPKPLANLPFLLVGPMLRKVTPNSVAVFIVTKEACMARLKIYKHNGNTTAPTTIATGTFENMFQLGIKMFLNVLTVNVGTTMSAGDTYGYDVEFSIGTATPGTVTHHLWDVNQYSNPNNIAHTSNWGMDHFEFIVSGAAQTLPTFVLPPTFVEDIRILHGSCRKPHGEGPDALERVYKIIYDNAVNPVGIATDPTTRRPQMLFLTGDQIYADDVADAMLYMITRYADLLIGWDEDLLPLGCDFTKLDPGERGINIKDVAKFSVEIEDAGSHLMKLREYAIMYCMVWSNALWEADANGNPVLPSFEYLYPGSAKRELKSNSYPTLSTLGFISTDVEFDTDIFSKYNRTTHYINLFFHSINKNIRTLLANIPTYMIFDDHEVTDDFLYNGEWYENVITNSPLGKRICTNGMAAYALFQDWGNKPEDYSTVGGAKLINDICSIGSGLNSISWNDPKWDEISKLVLPRLEPQNGQIPAYFTHNTNIGGVAGVNAMTWNYYYEVANAYEFLVLDTRSMRVFHDGLDGVPGLMSEEAMTKQIDLPGSSRSKSLVFVISPTPVIGVNYIERRKKLAVPFKYKEPMDYEHWSLDQKAYEHFLSKLFVRNPVAQPLKVILLGGDVHYGYSSRMEYWANNPYLETPSYKKMIISGLCASSFKNEVSAKNIGSPGNLKAVEAYSKAFHDDKLIDVADKSVVYGWQNKIGTTVLIGPAPSHNGTLIMNKIKIEKNLFTFDRNDNIIVDNEGMYSIITTNPIHDWQYRISPVKSNKPNFIPPPINGFSIEDYKNHIKIHGESLEKAGEGGGYIVGCNNLGDVMVETGPQGGSVIRHQLWWASDYERVSYQLAPNYPDIGQPYTVHKIDMTIGNEPTLNTP